VDNLTLDLDSTVMTRYGKPEGAAKGYNPSKPGRLNRAPIACAMAGVSSREPPSTTRTSGVEPKRPEALEGDARTALAGRRDVRMAEFHGRDTRARRLRNRCRTDLRRIRWSGYGRWLPALCIKQGLIHIRSASGK
jgi:hypothetical protein